MKTTTKITAVIKYGEAAVGDFVRWDGTPDPYHGKTTGLKPTEIYRIVDVDVHTYYTHLIIQETSSGNIFEEGVSSLIFTKVEVQNAVSDCSPVVGYCYPICKLVLSDGELSTYSGTTSRVVARYPNGSTNWYVVTRNSVYNVMVLPDET